MFKDKITKTLHIDKMAIYAATWRMGNKTKYALSQYNYRI